MKLDDREIPYHKYSFVTGNWKRKEGCRIVHGATISYQQPPPPCKYPTAPVPTAESQDISVPPFDLQEIPDVMRSLNMPVAAKLMERWFSGALNYSPTPEDEQALLNQEGKPYPVSMFDTTTVKLKWILKFARAKKGFEALKLRETLTTPKAIDQIRRRAEPYRAASRQLDALELCGRDLRTLHSKFQFQLRPVESSFEEKFKQYLEREFSENGIPDDLTASLGSFNFYAAIGQFGFDWRASKVWVYSILIYVKDNFTFTDRPGDVSQYLGHWSRSGLVLIPYDMALSEFNLKILPPVNQTWLTQAGAIGDPKVRGRVYYPVWNSSYREWQRMHYRGGDFIIFSDYVEQILDKPIEALFHG